MRTDEPHDSPGLGLPPEELNRILVEFSPDVLWLMDMDFRLVYVSPSLKTHLGYSPEEYLALSPEERHVPESLAILKDIQAGVQAELASPAGISRGRIRVFELQRRHKDGHILWGEVKAGIIWDAQGRPRGIHGVMRNIEDRKESERARLEEETRHRQLVEMLPIGVFECDLEGRIRYLNEAMFRMFLYPEEARGLELTIPQVIVPEDWERVRSDMARRITDSRRPPGVYTGLRMDGSKLPIEVHSAVIVKDGRPTGFRGVIIDVSDKKRYEAELLKSNKLDALGLLAGGIAHDFNNMLAAVMGNINLAGLEMADIAAKSLCPREVQTAERLLHEAELAILRARDLTSRLLTFSRGGSPVKEAFSLEALVAELGNFNTAGSACRFELHAMAGLPPIRADRSQLAQLVQNLVINAIQAMPAGGVVRASLGLEDGRLRLDVDDEGKGVPEDLRASIFDPYFTTKSSGSGLGLAVCLAVARGHGGDISVGDSSQGGARFTVYLPTGFPGECLENPGGGQDLLPSPGLRVLFVDDEEPIRKLAIEMGYRLGYKVVTAGDAQEAVEAWSEAVKKGGGFDLAIVDLTIRGGPGGREILARLKSLAPDLPVLVSSGYSEDPVLSDWRRAGFAGLLRKPYDLSAFVYAIETAYSAACRDRD